MIPKVSMEVQVLLPVHAKQACQEGGRKEQGRQFIQPFAVLIPLLVYLQGDVLVEFADFPVQVFDLRIGVKLGYQHLIQFYTLVLGSHVAKINLIDKPDILLVERIDAVSHIFLTFFVPGQSTHFGHFARKAQHGGPLDDDQFEQAGIDGAHVYGQYIFCKIAFIGQCDK